jgi:hypothetical protein
LNYGVKFDCIPLLCDNESVMKITTNLVQHKRIKHIDIRHHFLRDHVSKYDIVMKSVRTNDQLADIFTKPLDETRFCKLRSELNVIDLSNVAWNHVVLIVYLCHACMSLNCIILLSYYYVFLCFWEGSTHLEGALHFYLSCTPMYVNKSRKMSY